MAEARSAVTKPIVSKVDHESTPWDSITKNWLKGGLRRYYRTRNSIRNGMWPTSISNLSAICSLIFLLLMIDPSFCKPLVKRIWKLSDHLPLPQSVPLFIRAAVISSILGFAFIFIIMLLRQYILRILLSYRGWMDITGRKQPKRVIIWGLLVRLISGYQPSLYSFQRSLPRMPVPTLRETLHKLFESLKPVCTEEELALLKKQAKEFKTTIGPKLQKLLVLKSWLTQNYVTDWWEKYVYLRSRLPLPINCNYYILDQSYWKATDRPTARAASLISNLLVFKRMIDREELSPIVLRNTIPICMSQYERLFSTTRIPLKDMDELVHYDTKDSKHIIIVCNGLYYKVDVYDAHNQIISMKKLEEKIEWIISDSNKHAEFIKDEEKSISSLTTLERNDWSKIRKDYLCSGINNESREIVESSIFIVWLMLNYSPETLTERGKLVLHGDGKSIWFDKCFNVMIFANGKCGLNCEHSLADAPAYAHMWEFTLCRDVLEKTFDDDGTCMPPNKTFRQAALSNPRRLVWEITDELSDKINYAREQAVKNNDDLDLAIIDHNSWGKGEIKKCNISPDAFVQIALQLAYYKDSGNFVQTYEASMTRLYLNGRTETVRSCTQEVVDFVMAMTKNHVTKDEKINLLNKAVAKHTNLYKDAMNGKGIDRHLFALYVTCKALGYESEFLHNVLTRPWTLSTSQTPHTQQTAVPDPNYKSFNDKLCAGGGFGPVSDDGYGVSYLLPNDYRIYFHISSKKSCTNTDSVRLGKLLYDSLDEIKALFEN